MATQDVYGLVGQVLDGQFRVDRVIGEGGFSVVYRGQHVGLDEPVAIKCLKLQTQLGSALVEAFIRRFRDESKIHYRLSRGSLHIARTIAAGTTMAPAIGALVPYMVLEWLEGYTLSEELRARRQRGERGRNIQEVIRLLDPVADAMAFAHAQGVVHRDLNPSNIFVAFAHGSSKLKVLDFGVAKVVSDHALSLGPRAATVGHIRMFTPAYAAPEQFHDALGPIGPQTDVYSFAVLVVELLADRTPIEGEHIGEYADRALDPEHRPTPRAMGIAIGDAVEAVLAKAVTVDPSQRPSDIGEFWGMLKNAATRDAQQNREGGEPGFPKPPIAAAPSARAGFGSRQNAGGMADTPPVAEQIGSAPWEKEGADQEAGRYGFYSTRPEAPSHDPEAAPKKEVVEVPRAAFAQTARSAAGIDDGHRSAGDPWKSPTGEGASGGEAEQRRQRSSAGGEADRPLTRQSAGGEADRPLTRQSGGHASAEPHTIGVSKDTSRIGGPPRKVTLLHGTPGPPTPTPGPYTASVVETPAPAPAPPAAGGVSRPTAFAATVQTPMAPEPYVSSGSGSPAPPSRSPKAPWMPPRGAVWHAPVIRPKIEAPDDPIVTPKKSNVPLLVLLALALTVALVVVAIVINEIGR